MTWYRHSGPTVATFIAVGALLRAVSVDGQGPTNSDVFGCWSNAGDTRTGSTRIVGRDEGCRKGEYRQSWNLADEIRKLTSPDSTTRMNAALQLRQMKHASAISPLLSALGDEDASVLLEVGEALAQISKGDRSVLNRLVTASVNEDWRVRAGSMRALWFAKDHRSSKALIARLNDDNADVRWWAARTLNELRDPTVTEAFVSALRKRNIEAIAGAHTFFIELGQPGSETLLLSAFDFAKRTQHSAIPMAEAFLNSGNRLLEDAARTWFKTIGAKTTVYPGLQPRSRWGGVK